jgi:U3 small nucleolar RNA-associated protein 22
MAPPATKRRKLEQSEDESEGSFAEFDELDNAGSDVEEEANGDDSDVSMEGPADGEHVSDDEDAEESMAQKSKQPQLSATVTPAQKAPKRPAATLQDGAYTSESFKSNMFKLQVDELLEQVKPKYGKKEAPAENAMRTLKTIIESISSRDALPVRFQSTSSYALLTICRSPKLRRL